MSEMNQISIFVANLVIEYQRMKDLIVAAISNDIYRINSDKYKNAVEDQIAMMRNAMEEQKNIIEKVSKSVEKLKTLSNDCIDCLFVVCSEHLKMLENVLSVRAQLETNLKMKHKLVNEKTAMQICIEQELAAVKTPTASDGNLHIFRTPSMPTNATRVMMDESLQVEQRLNRDVQQYNRDTPIINDSIGDENQSTPSTGTYNVGQLQSTKRETRSKKTKQQAAAAPPLNKGDQLKKSHRQSSPTYAVSKKSKLCKPKDVFDFTSLSSSDDDEWICNRVQKSLIESNRKRIGQQHR